MVIIPSSLQGAVLKILHSVHQGVSSMCPRAQSLLYWPGIIKDINKERAEWSICCKNAPSHLMQHHNIPDIPSTPFEYVFADFFDLLNRHYLIAGDRLSGWVEVFSSSSGASKSGAAGGDHSFTFVLCHFWCTRAIVQWWEGPEFTAPSTQEFFKCWGIHHRLSSAHFPQSNGRAEVAVKKAKRILFDCVGPAGSLNSNKFLQGMLHIRNTPDPDCKLPPAQIIFGLPLHDAFSFI